jgi:PHD/YefM family antitoxin component YafN of YafNO toxin-antitoxin module
MDAMPRKERFMVDEQGNRVSVVLDLKDYERMLEELEELASIRAYDAAKAAKDEAIPFDQAVEELERGKS